MRACQIHPLYGLSTGHGPLDPPASHRRSHSTLDHGPVRVQGAPGAQHAVTLRSVPQDTSLRAGASWHLSCQHRASLYFYTAWLKVPATVRLALPCLFLIFEQLDLLPEKAFDWTQDVRNIRAKKADEGCLCQKSRPGGETGAPGGTVDKHRHPGGNINSYKDRMDR